MTAHRIVATADAILSKNLALGNAKIGKKDMTNFRNRAQRGGYRKLSPAVLCHSVLSNLREQMSANCRKQSRIIRGATR